MTDISHLNVALLMNPIPDCRSMSNSDEFLIFLKAISSPLLFETIIEQYELKDPTLYRYGLRLKLFPYDCNLPPTPEMWESATRDYSERRHKESLSLYEEFKKEDVQLYVAEHPDRMAEWLEVLKEFLEISNNLDHLS